MEKEQRMRVEVVGSKRSFSIALGVNSLQLYVESTRHRYLESRKVQKKGPGVSVYIYALVTNNVESFESIS